MHGKTQKPLIQEDIDCITNWENFVLLDRLPHELGLAAEPYKEDIEAIKTMKKWADQKAEHERKKQESKMRMRKRMKIGGGTAGVAVGEES